MKRHLKTLLLNLPWNLDDVTDCDSVAQPYGLAVISSLLKSNGLDVTLYDANAHHTERQRLVEYVNDLKPDIIGTTLYTCHLPQTISFLKQIKEIRPDIVTVVGGPHPSSEEHVDLLEQYPEIDMAVRGEGEYTLFEIIESFESRNSVTHIKGLVYRDAGEIKVNPLRYYIQDLDVLPFADWDSLPMDNYWAVASEKKNLANILFSRGCRYSCTFCGSKVALGRKVRKRSPGSIIEEIKYLYEKHNVRELAINDATFNVDFEWNRQIARRLIEYNKPDLVWGCNLRADRTVKMDIELLKLMKRSGLRNIFMGVESGDDRMLKSMKKGTTVEMIRAALRMLDEAKIKVYLGFIMGMPGETESSLQKTLSFARELRKYSTAFSIATPFPGTELYQQAKKEGFQVDDWAKFDYHDITYVPKNLTREKLYHYYTRTIFNYYLNIRFLASQVLQLKSWLQFIKTFRLGYRILMGRRKRLKREFES